MILTYPLKLYVIIGKKNFYTFLNFTLIKCILIHEYEHESTRVRHESIRPINFHSLA